MIRGLSREEALKPLALRLGDHRFLLLFLALALLFVAQVLAGGGRDGSVLGPAGVGVLAAVLFAVSGSRWVLWTAVVLAVPASALAVGLGEGWTALAGSGFHAPLFGFAACAVSYEVVRARRADADVLVGSICAYLLVAAFFASLYAGIEASAPGSFQREPSDRSLFGDLLYFSLVAITTLGYGDVTPVSSLAVALTTLEPVFGVLFLSIVVARLVSQAAGDGAEPFAVRDVEVIHRPGRFELLILVAVASMLLAPFSGGPWMEITLRSSATALLLAALYAAVDGPGIRTLGVGLAVLVTGLRWGSSAQWASTAAPAAELVFLLLVCVALLQWLFRARRVTRELLLAAIALYLLIGFSVASAFELVETLQPGSVVGADGSPVPAGRTLYYAFMTLTTTGFGEISPGSAAAERVAVVASLVGVFYPPVLVGRIVSLYEGESA